MMIFREGSFWYVDDFMKMTQLNRKQSFLCLWVEKVRQSSHFLWRCTLVNISIRK